VEESKQPVRGPRGKKVVRGLWIGLAVLGAALLIMALWLYVGPDTATEKKDFIQAVGVLIAGLAGFVGLYFTWTNLDQTRRTTQRTLELTEQGQITERFTRAIDQLGATDDDGNPRLEVRLGGIYALERIDKESPERSYHPTVMEVLTAYVRENSHWDHEKPPTPTSGSNEDTEQGKDVEQDEEPTIRQPSTDIQAILDVLQRRMEDHVPERHRVFMLDLQGADLCGARLIAADLRRANLEGANFRAANLWGGYLQEAQLQRASLREAKLLAANLEKTWLAGANLLAANLKEANLKGADLQAADLRGTKNLAPKQIERAIGHHKTTLLPEGLHPPEMWSKSEEEQVDQVRRDQ
jgi:hypothetical protein